eukprot:m.591503 g.591503  ORF g.591503 m.591503 type:complete len:169 (+) comp58016_c0_seq5:169-675(+)
MDESSRPEGSRARAYTKSGSPPRQLLSSVSVRVEGFGRLSSGSLGRSMPNVNCDAPDDRARMKLSRHLSFRGSRVLRTRMQSFTFSPQICTLPFPLPVVLMVYPRRFSSAHFANTFRYKFAFNKATEATITRSNAYLQARSFVLSSSLAVRVVPDGAHANALARTEWW